MNELVLINLTPLISTVTDQMIRVEMTPFDRNLLLGRRSTIADVRFSLHIINQIWSPMYSTFALNEVWNFML